MSIKNRKSYVLNFALVLALLGGIFGVIQVHAATLTVTNTNDSGTGSLRQAITNAVSGDTITFNSSLAGQTITLASNLVITKNLTIDGSGLSPQITINGGNIAHLEIDGVISPIVTISDLTIANGYTSGDGGAIFSGSEGILTVINSTLRNNYALGAGGAIFGFRLTLQNTAIYNNQAGGGGAIYLVGNGNSTIDNSTIFQNEASDSGGAIFMQGNGVIDIFNSTFAGNTAASGKEVWISGNIIISLYNSIFACTAPDNSNCYVMFGNSQIGNNQSIVDVGSLADFGLAELADNGGPTKTLALLPGSPLIDAGDNATCLSTDQRGIARPQGSHCDIGAYEDQTTVRYVKWNASGVNNGTSWTDAYTDIQSALANAIGGDEIWVAAGTYRPTSGTDRTISFTLKNGVAIYGGFAGTETLVTQRDCQTNVTLLTGDIGAVDDNSDNSYHVFVGSNTNNSAMLDGFTITDGNANNPSSGAAHKGGGMYNTNGNPTLTNLSFTNNSAVWGGGIANDDQSSPILTNVTFSGNTTQSETDFPPSGGGMFNTNSSPSLVNVTFHNNSAEYGGGLFNHVSSSPTLVNVSFSSNSAVYGSGILSRDANSSPTLTNVTLSNNSASIDGGTIANAGSPVIRNSILWGNTGGEIININLGVPIVTNSIVQGGYSGTGNLDVNPLLGTLQDNGGFTQTMTLQSGSPAIDAGDDVSCPSTDQRGVARPQGSHCDIGAYEYVDTTAPSVTAFSVPASPTTLDIPITTFTASDDAVIAGYLITKSATPPDLNDAGWTATTPTTYPVASMGSYTLYPWVKDATGHVSVLYGSPATVNISCLDTITVTSNADSGPGTLRQALADACLGDINNISMIDFDSALSGDTIHLGSELTIAKNVTIDGSDLTSRITISGDDTVRVFNIPSIPLVTLTITLDSLIVTNGATSGHGAGLYMGQGMHVTIKKSIFSDNHAGGRGGGIGNQGSLTLIDSTVSGNSAASTDGGGGISNESGLTMTNSTISSNIATGATASGGGLFNTGGATIMNSTIFGNSSNVYGGGISTTANLTITNSTIAGNSAAVTGGLQVDGNVTHLRNTIIANNTSTTINSSIHNDCSDTSDYPNPPTPNGDGIMTNLNNLIEDGSCSPSLSGDPLLGPFADNGGPTQTVALLDGSNAIDAGDDTICAGTYHPVTNPNPINSLDQRGVTRPQGSHCDIGAYEYMDTVSPTVLSSVRFNTNPTNLTNVQFTITFSEPVTGVNEADFALTISGLTGTTITNVNGSGRIYTVTVNTGSSNGTIQLGVVDDDSILDGSNNLLGGIGAANGDFTSGEVYMILKSVPYANVQVSIAGNNVGTHNIAQKYNLKTSYAGLDNGPVRVTSTLPLVASERVAYSPDGGTTWTSYSELMGLPSNQVASSYTFPWYNNLDLNSQLRFGNVGTANTTVTVTVGGVFKGAYTLIPNESKRVSYAGLDAGPVRITSSGNVPIIASMRVAYFDGSAWTSFSEIMGMPTPKLTNSYVFPWYNNLDLNSQLRFGNVGAAPTTVTVTVAGVFKGSYQLAVNESKRVSYAGLDAGPVKVTSSGNVPIIASMRVAYNNGSAWTDFSEMMGLPSNSLSSHYSFPIYDNVRHNSQLRIGNVGFATTTVTITINGVLKDTFNLAPNGSRRVSYVGSDAGPVVIQSSGNIPIIASERVAYFDGSAWTSFSEMMGLPQSQLTTTFLFPWYNNVDLNSQLRFGVP